MYTALNASSKLTGVVGVGVTTVPVTAGTGTQFAVGSNHSYVTFQDATNKETCKITGQSGDNLTVVRTKALSWAIGSVIECRPCAEAMADYAVGPQISTATSASSIAGADELPFVETSVAGALKRITWTAFKALLTGVANVWTAAQTFRAANGVRSEAASTQDAVVIAGRAGGSGSLAATITPATLSANRTATLPDASGTLAFEDVSRIQTCWIPAGAMIARTTNGAAGGTVETTTNKNMLKTLDFDATTAEYAQFAINMPKSWDESTGITAVFVWSHAATATNFGVAWELAAVSVSDNDAMDVAFGTAQTVTDTGGVTNNCYITAATAAITVAGTPQANDLVMFQVNRAPANASDNMAIDARLHGIRLMYSINTLTDA